MWEQRGVATLFGAAPGPRLKLDVEPMETLRRFRQIDSGQPEAGGVLIGRRIRGGLDVIVDEVTVPQEEDRRSRCHFFRHHRAHQRLIDAAWERSGGAVGYLGEWHSHPERVPHPSRTDLEDWARRLFVDQVEADCVFFLIIGEEAARVWCGSRSRRRLRELPFQEQLSSYSASP